MTEQKNTAVPPEKNDGTKSDNKGKQFIGQYKTVYQSLREHPKTMLSVSIETGILRANICRYIAEMLDKGQAQVVRKGLCPYTRFLAGFYSTDPALFSQVNNHPTLF